MYILVFLFFCLLSNPLEAGSSDDELVESIMRVARESFSDQENVKMLRHLIYEQNFTNPQVARLNSGINQGGETSTVDSEKPTLFSSVSRLFSMEGSGSESETSEENRRRDKFFKYLVNLYKEFPLVRIGYNPSHECDKSKGYVTLCFYIQEKYHHPALVFEYQGFWGSINAELFHLSFGEESGSGEKKEGKEVYRVRRDGKEEIINKLVWARNNKNGNDDNDEHPDRGILRWYPYHTFEVDLKKMHKTRSKLGWAALKKEHSYHSMGLIYHNCCTYVAEQLEEMGINLKYKKSYKLYFTDEDLKKLVLKYAAGNYERMHKVKYAELVEEDKNKGELPKAIANRSNLYFVLKEKAKREKEKNLREEEIISKKAKIKKEEEEKKEKIKIEEAKISFKLKNYCLDAIESFTIYCKIIFFFMYCLFFK